MRIGIVTSIALSLAAGLSAQHRGTTPIVVGTVGSVVNPGAPAGIPGVRSSVGSVVNPAGGGVHVVVPGQNHGIGPAAQRNRGVYAYPVYLGGYYDNPYISQQPEMGPVAPAQPNVTVVMPPQQQTPTPVVINNFYPGASTSNPEGGRAPVMQREMDSAGPTSEPNHYLIAFQDHTIYAATAYWVDGDTLHYFTSGNTHNQVSLSLVDRQFTERLNKEAGVDVRLPAPPK